MGFDRIKIKQIIRVLIIAAMLVAGVIYIKDIWKGVCILLGILLPFIVGGAIAFVLNLPLCGIENKIFKKWKGKAADKLKRPLSILMSILFVAAIITVVVITVVPQLTDTISEIGQKVPGFLRKVTAEMNALAIKYPQIKDIIAELKPGDFDWNETITYLAGFMKSGVFSALSSTISFASNVLSGFTNFFIGLVFAIYILAQKEKIEAKLKRTLQAYTKAKTNDKVLRIARLLHLNFSGFITGQCVEALILGSLFIIFMLIFRLPYALLVGILIGFSSLIPIVGALIGCIVGALLMLMSAPDKFVIFLVMFLVLQQIEGNLIYPRVVGGKVGLPSILVLFAVTVGGSLFGIVGMLVFIPLVSTLYALVNENVDNILGVAQKPSLKNAKGRVEGNDYGESIVDWASAEEDNVHAGQADIKKQEEAEKQEISGSGKESGSRKILGGKNAFISKKKNRKR